jgi:hypothetical protein
MASFLHLDLEMALGIHTNNRHKLASCTNSWKKSILSFY